VHVLDASDRASARGDRGTDRSTSTRRGAMQVCPAFIVDANQMLSAAARRSASASTIALSRPESSSVVGQSVRAQAAAISRPTAVEPVNTTWSHPPSSTSLRPSSRVDAAHRTLPSGRPAADAHFAARSTSIACDRGERSLGFTVTRLPAITACTNWIPISCSG
jgi:hypothetical protein